MTDKEGKASEEATYGRSPFLTKNLRGIICQQGDLMLLPASLQFVNAGERSTSKLKEVQSRQGVTGKESYQVDSEDDEFDPDQKLSDQENVRPPNVTRHEGP